MGIEYHQGRPYFYRKVRRGGRVVSEYVCGGMLAAGMAELAEDGRAERAAADEAWRAERGRMEAEDRAHAEYFDAVEARVREMLTAAGYHRPKRRWRKRRVDTNATPDAPDEGADRAALEAPVRDLLLRAIDGDETCLPALDAMFDCAAGPKLVALYGDLPGFAADVVIKGMSGQSLLLREAIRRKVAGIRDELAGPDPTPLERLLAERAAYCWLTLWRYEHALAGETDLPARREEFHHRRIESAQRRYLSSLRTLAQVRKLAVPDVRVNIGPNQVHVAGESASAARDARPALKVGP